MKFDWTRSPLSYHGYSPQRLALIDPKAPDPHEKNTYFAETKKELRKKNRQRYKKPRYETIPGATDPKTVAFLDYSLQRNYYKGKDLVYFHYVSSRDPRKGNAKALFNKILQKHGKDTYYDFGDIMSPAVYKIYRQWQLKGLEARGKNWGSFGDDEVGLKRAARRVALRYREKTAS